MGVKEEKRKEKGYIEKHSISGMKQRKKSDGGLKSN